MNRLLKIYGQKKATLLAFLISPNFVLNLGKGPDLIIPYIQEIDMLLSLDSAVFITIKYMITIQKQTNPILDFQSLLVLMLYMILKLDFELILKNNQVLQECIASRLSYFAKQGCRRFSKEK